jgi:hypothetical protein
MILRGDEQNQRYCALCRERQLQRPEKSGDDQQPGQAEYEMENRISPSAVASGSTSYEKKQPATKNAAG